MEVALSKPIVAATLLVRDEEDVIAENLRHHIAQGVDYFVVTDNASRDQTKDIVRSFSEVATIIDEPAMNYRQADWVSRMANVVHEIGADWVIHLDADEFWTGLQCLENIESNFLVVNSGDHTNPGCCSGMSCRNFVPITDDQQPVFHVNNYRYFRYSEHKAMKGCKIAHRCMKNLEIGQGNHQILNIPEEKVTFCPDLKIDHYPIRSYEHFERKVINGGLAYLQSGLTENIGDHWRERYQVYLSEQLWLEYKCLSYTKRRAEQLVFYKELYVDHQ
jgi:hypothetical protein